MTPLVRLHVGSSCGQDGGTDLGRSWRAGGAAVVSGGSGRRGLAAGAGRGEFSQASGAEAPAVRGVRVWPTRDLELRF